MVSWSLQKGEVFSLLFRKTTKRCFFLLEKKEMKTITPQMRMKLFERSSKTSSPKVVGSVKSSAKAPAKKESTNAKSKLARLIEEAHKQNVLAARKRIVESRKRAAAKKINEARARVLRKKIAENRMRRLSALRQRVNEDRSNRLNALRHRVSESRMRRLNDLRRRLTEGRRLARTGAVRRLSASACKRRSFKSS